jgi:hypothetical protein
MVAQVLEVAFDGLDGDAEFGGDGADVGEFTG